MDGFRLMEGDSHENLHVIIASEVRPLEIIDGTLVPGPQNLGQARDKVVFPHEFQAELGRFADHLVQSLDEGVDLQVFLLQHHGIERGRGAGCILRQLRVRNLMDVRYLIDHRHQEVAHRVDLRGEFGHGDRTNVAAA